MEQKQKILLIEDDPLMINLYKQTFFLNGFDLDVAEDGLAGLALLKDSTQKPSVILLDIMMPKMNGFQVLEHLKKNPATKDIPVMILTNLAQPGDVEKVLQMGAAMYLIKSEHGPRETVEKIRQTIAKK
jgi:two-component system alkaline phosphatase synthesis response regulator PhoP